MTHDNPLSPGLDPDYVADVVLEIRKICFGTTRIQGRLYL